MLRKMQFRDSIKILVAFFWFSKNFFCSLALTKNLDASPDKNVSNLHCYIVTLETGDLGIQEQLFRFKLATQIDGQSQDTKLHGEKKE